MDHHLNPIPRLFFLNSAENTFRKCIACERDLYLGDCDYVIEKAIRRFPEIDASEVIFEYAICTDCAGKARQKLSEESRQRIDELLHSEKVKENSLSILAQATLQNGDATGICMLTGNAIDDCEEYQIYAYCRGTSLSLNSNAFMLSGKAMEIIAELLSEETKDELDRFRDTFFGLPPELEDIIYSRDLIML
ncbi:MAG TPA: hypothetical protein DDW81_15375 [Cryomorphaceae bacterium]|nr:hypothetical protein [Cryomorphaceae bacterium]